MGVEEDTAVTGVAAAISAVSHCQHLVQRPQVVKMCSGSLADAGQAVTSCIQLMEVETQKLDGLLTSGAGSGDSPLLCARARSIVAKSEALDRVVQALPSLQKSHRFSLARIRQHATTAAAQASGYWASEVSHSGSVQRTGTSDTLVSFDAGGNMVVSVSTDDLRKTSDTRRMAELGVMIPEAARKSL